jgi:PHP family Zn ribbon phosphoesterase
MRIIADLHLHSRYSRATSPKMNIRDLSDAAKIKGVNLLGTGDFTHPQHLSDLKRDLTEDRDGFFFYNNSYFVLSAEIANIFSLGGKVRKVHNVILAPSFEIVDQINDGLRKWGRLDYDGRHIFGRMCTELMDLCMGISRDVLVIPAHIWTPWFSLFGSNSGFDRIEDCFQDHVKNIHALETGLSSYPAMNWRLSQLDRFSLVSNSDSHSPYPWRFGREANVFEIDRKSTRLNSSHNSESRMPSSA